MVHSDRTGTGDGEGGGGGGGGCALLGQESVGQSMVAATDRPMVHSDRTGTGDGEGGWGCALLGQESVGQSMVAATDRPMVHSDRTGAGDGGSLDTVWLPVWDAIFRFFRYFWPDPFSADPFSVFSIFSYFIFFFLNFLSLFVFTFCETARTRRFSVIFAKVQWHPCCVVSL